MAWQSKITPPRRKLDGKRVITAMRLNERIWHYAKDHYHVPATVEAMLRAHLLADGVDLTRPHDLEVWGPCEWRGADGEVESGTLTWGEARKLGYEREH